MFGPCLILWDFAFEPWWATSLSTHSVRHDRDLGGGIYVTEFSARTRVANLDRLRDETFDVLVVGGGIVGAGVARDAGCRGLRTALVERGDFASGTSGKTSRLIHGGLRYLRSYRVGLVRQSVSERDLLLRRAPSLVHPLAFVIPAYRGRRPGALLLRFGLFLYDFLSRDKTVPRRVWLAADATVEREPRLSSDALAGAGIYFDAWTDDARLVLAVVKGGAEAGACVANYTEVVELLHDDGGRVVGARLRDVIENRTLDARARIAVNATGVWLDRLRAPRGIPTIRATKGIHIFLPRTKVGNRHALALTAPRDGRIVFRSEGGGRVVGARLRDVIENRTLDARARIAVNATGVWLDRLRAPRGIPTIRATKGIHIFLPRTKVGNRHALALTAPRDGRIVF